MHLHTYIHKNLSILRDTHTYKYRHTFTHTQLQGVKATQEVRALEHFYQGKYTHTHTQRQIHAHVTHTFTHVHAHIDAHTQTHTHTHEQTDSDSKWPRSNCVWI